MISNDVDEKYTTEFLKIIARSGVKEILNELDKKPSRFSELMFSTQLNPGILNRHLKILTKINLISKDGEFYFLTEKGRKLVEIINELLELD